MVINLTLQPAQPSNETANLGNAATFQAAVNSLGTAGGRIMVPPGGYWLEAPVEISEGPIEIVGAGNDDLHPGISSQNHGTVLAAWGTGFRFSGTGSRGSALRRLGGRNPVGNPSDPAWLGTALTRPAFVDVVNSQGFLDLEDLFFPHAFTAIRARRSGRLRVRGVRASAIAAVLDMDDCRDVCHLDDIHAWPFFTLSKGTPYSIAQSTHLRVLRMGKVDSFYLGRVFGFNCFSVLHLENMGNGISRHWHVNHLYADFARCAVFSQGEVRGPNEPEGHSAAPTGCIDHLTFQGEDHNASTQGVPLPNNCPVVLLNRCDLSVGNLHAEDVSSFTAYLDGAGTLRIGSWKVDNANPYHAAFYCGAGATVQLSQPPLPLTMGGHPLLKQGAGSVLVPQMVTS